jgi:hypothetical protein
MRLLTESVAAQPDVPAAAEQAAWIVITAAERLSGELTGDVVQSRYADAAHLLRRTVRLRWNDDKALRAASPTFVDSAGQTHALLDVVTRFRDDAETGVQAAVMCFLAFDWRSAS